MSEFPTSSLLGHEHESVEESEQERADRFARLEQEEAYRAEREEIEREEVHALFEQEMERLQELRDNSIEDDRVKVISQETIVVPYDKIDFELVGGKTMLEVMQEQNEKDRKSNKHKKMVDRIKNRPTQARKRRR